MHYFFISEQEIPRIEQLELECFYPYHWQETEICSHLLAGGKIMLSEQKDSYLVFMENEEEAEILRIGVILNKRKQGLAKKMLGEWMQQMKGKYLFLEVRESNVAAIALYQNAGFQKSGLRKKYYTNSENAILFTFTPH